MDQTACYFVENETSDLNHPLHLHCDTANWISAFGRCDSPCVVSICHKKHAYHSYQTKLFVVLHLKNISSECHRQLPDLGDLNKAGFENGTGRKIGLFSSNEFHLHYGIERDDDCMVVGPVTAFPLSRVILSAKTEDTFTWANGKGLETGLMIAGTCHKNLLVRQDDQFLAIPHRTFGDDPVQTLYHFKNLNALECYPVKQGYIHANTEVVITEIDISNRNVQETGISTSGTLCIELMTQDLLWRLSLDGGCFDPQTDVLCHESAVAALGVKDGDFVDLQITATKKDDEDMDREFLSLRLDNAPLDEGEYFSIDMPQQLPDLHEEQVLSHDLHAVCRLRVGRHDRKNVDFECTKKSRFLNPCGLYINPLLWFNITHERKFQNHIKDFEVKVKLLNEDDIPPYATEIHLALILSPTYSLSAQFDNTLVKHMSTTRILRKDDVICINTKNNPDFLGECEAKDTSCEALFYKVKRFGQKEESSSQTHFRVDLHHSSLYQDGTVNSFIPNSAEIPTDCDVTAGLSDYTDKMREILLPYVTMEMDTSVATMLVSGTGGCGKWSAISTVCRMLNMHMVRISCYELLADSSGAMDAKINTAIQRALVYAPCMVVLNGIDCLGRDVETGQPDHRVCSGIQSAIESLRSGDHPIVVVGVTNNKSELVAKIRTLFLHQIEISALTEEQRTKVIRQLLNSTPTGRDVDVRWIAKHTVGFTYGDMWELAKQAAENARSRITKECAVGSRLSWMDEMNICAAGITNQHCDFTLALQHIQSQRADIIGVPKIPDVKWEDIGGLEEVKSHIKDTIQLPLEHPELVASGLRRSGILLYGPPGTGKTLLAKAVATQCSLSFLSVKGPELINMYVGQSEENVRKVFSRARDAAPCVVFFDELDSLAPNRGRSGDSGGVMDRVVSQLLAELDGLMEADKEKQIFVIGASNRPDLIDTALLRPGRFDKLLYVGINSSKTDQLKILKAQTGRANLAPEVNLDEVIDACPENMTGADFYALTSEALMNAIRRRIAVEEDITTKSKVKTDDSPVMVNQEDFIRATRHVIPSVSARELSRFDAMRNQMTLQ